MGELPGWAELEAAVPQVAATMRRYLIQIGCALRPGSVSGADQALRCFAAFVAQAAPGVTAIAQVTRGHIEDYKPWLAARPGQNKPRLTPAAIARRLATLRMFFIRLDEWGRDEAPSRVPVFTGDLGCGAGATVDSLSEHPGHPVRHHRLLAVLVPLGSVGLDKRRSTRADGEYHVGKFPHGEAYAGQSLHIWQSHF